ncbi:peptide deformylase [Algibacter pacificus]|uniref:peptide deformylase n=1 Tax=Algibacter pacificus TaxID=2599389 RepID=UPI0011C88DE9|nr:peptide deformylase [Algibacter pacificus]
MKKQLFILSLILMLAACTSCKTFVNQSFSPKELSLINASDSLTPMRIYKITNQTDSLLLRSKSTFIKPDPKNSILKTFINRLYNTVRDSISMGVGIAAPQVGILKNIIWVQRFDKENLPFEVYLNPKITNYSQKKQSVKEGCLSIPNRSDMLNSRSFFIDIEYDTMNAEHKSETISNFTAVIFQHEIDHLNGILYLDHLKNDISKAKKNKK